MALQWTLLTYVLFSVLMMNIIGIAGFSFVITITNDFKTILKAIGKCSQNKKRHKQIYPQFIEFFDLHAIIKQLSCCFLKERPVSKGISIIQVFKFED